MTRAPHTKRRRIRGANPGFTQGEAEGPIMRGGRKEG